MNKYIIKNCPSYTDDYNRGCVSFDVEEHKCEDCTDCLPKRIVEKCKEQKVPTIWNCKNDTEYFICSARHTLAQDILSMLEIEECEG